MSDARCAVCWLPAARDVLRIDAGGSRNAMTPDAWLIILFAVLTLAGYLLWATGRLRGVRIVLGVLAVVALVLAIVLHDLEVSAVATRAGTASDTETDADGTGG